MAECCLKGSPDHAVYANEVCEAMQKTDFDMLASICDEIFVSKRLGRTIYIAGNGGSAATASHFVNDLIKGCRVDGNEGFRAMSLNDSTPVVTCLANDFNYDEVFEIYLKTLAQKGDLLIVFSGSGNSPNIIRACKTAKEMELTVIGFGGRDGGLMAPLCDLCLIAPTYCMEQLEDLHMFYVHALVSRLRVLLEQA